MLYGQTSIGNSCSVESVFGSLNSFGIFKRSTLGFEAYWLPIYKQTNKQTNNNNIVADKYVSEKYVANNNH